MCISPLSLRPKSNGQSWRLLHDLSYPYDDTSVNSSIPKKNKEVKYSSIQDAIAIIQQLGKGAQMGKSDLASAYTQVPIHPDDYKFLGFKWKNNYYYYKTLPQGAASSCFIFQRISTAIKWILQQKYEVHHTIHYLDDYLFLAPTSDECLKSMQTFHQVCEEIGFPVNPEKTEGPTPCLTFLGIHLDSITFQASLPMDKVLKYNHLMSSFLQRKTCTLHEMQQVIGSLQFTTSVVLPGRTFLRRLINSTIGIQKPFHHIHLSKEIKEDILLWQKFLRSHNGTSFFIPSTPIAAPTLNLQTDACPAGFGGTYKTHYYLGTFPRAWTKFNICVLELYPILLALQLFAAQMSNTHIIIFSDNIAVVEVLNSKTTKHPQMLILLRQLVLHCLQHNIIFTGKHISGKYNVLADALSRSIHTSKMLQEHLMDTQPTVVPENLLPHNYNLS